VMICRGMTVLSVPASMRHGRIAGSLPSALVWRT
jgi:hypothetical protein